MMFIPSTDYRSRTPLEVRNPRWKNAEHTILDVDVLFEELEPVGLVPFTATVNADTDHGVEIWEKGLAGEYGPIADYVPPLPTIGDYRTAIQSLIDAKAQEKDYDSGATLASYVNSTIPQWASEATAFVAWRDQVWAYALAELDRVQKAERDQPSVDDFLAELPAFEWPATE